MTIGNKEINMSIGQGHIGFSFESNTYAPRLTSLPCGWVLMVQNRQKNTISESSQFSFQFSFQRVLREFISEVSILRNVVTKPEKNQGHLLYCDLLKKHTQSLHVLNKYCDRK